MTVFNRMKGARRHPRYWRLLAMRSSWDSSYQLSLWALEMYGTPDCTGTPLVPVTVTASRTDGANIPAHVADGNPATFWDTGNMSEPQSITLDFGPGGRVVRSLRLLARDATAVDRAALSWAAWLQSSFDGTTWTTAATLMPTNAPARPTLPYGTIGPWQAFHNTHLGGPISPVLPAASVTHRYYRLLITAPMPTSQSIGIINFRLTRGPAVWPPDMTSATSPAPYAVTSNAVSTNVDLAPWMACDNWGGQYGSLWNGSTTAGQWLMVDCGSATGISGYKLQIPWMTSFGPTAYRLEGSPDATTWTTVSTENGTGWSYGGEVKAYAI